MREGSLLVKAGRKFNDYKGSMNPPVYHSSTILFPTYKDYLSAANGESIYDVINDGVARDYSYSNVGTPTVHYFSNALAEIEGRGRALIYPSGLFAITFAILTFTKAGSHVLIQDNSYYRLKRFAENELPKRGVEVTFYNPTQDIDDLVQSNTSLIMIETPGSITFEISNIEHIVKVAKERGIVTVCDNSWATPLLFKPLDYEIDISLYAVTKYLAGHSDLVMGAIVAEGETFKLLYESYKNYGVTIQSHDCYLAHRGLRTLQTRMRKHQSTAMQVAKWLEKHPKIKRVLYPALPSHPQHELWKSYFKGASSVLSIVLDREYSCEELGCMVDHMKVFGIGASWGGCDSLVLPIDHRSISRSVMNSDYGGSFVRIFFGLEDPEDLIFDLNTALIRLPCSSVKDDCETERATA
ncbi:cystathionine beta-lyase [Wolbachia endosymbiont of Trichogramma pretiosum]|uniref:cystathionine beta-lyase n=1 Tax=Wolbachia endosymbiont of Trichogramma pretiosum TaxID=125593 RepID=UPI0008392F8E|nr:cystathionine beta-lyase [Wolbachia endosymbiont of Trichogramma pretiosum]OCA06077.1 cystathionine beta-lyase [Wolbachia endosymbiont of Trichogramma pretiosum]